MSKRNTSIYSSVSIVCLATALSACAVEQEEPEPSVTSIEQDILLREIRSNGLRITGLDPATKQGAAEVKLNAGDPLHRQLIGDRLHLVGKTPENSPQLFQRLAQGSQKADSYKDLPDDCRNPLSVTQDTNNTNRWIARVVTSCFAGSDYSYVDLFWWNTRTGNVLAYDFSEDFNQGTDLILTIEANAADIGTIIHVDSMAISSQGTEEFYGFEQNITTRSSGLARLDTLIDPKDFNQNGVVLSCLERGTPWDCDYFFLHSDGKLMLPIHMKFRFPDNVQSIISARAQVHMRNTGGVCETLDLKQYVSFSLSEVTLNTGEVSFGTRCVDNQANVRLWVKILVRNTRGEVQSVYWANDLPTHPINYLLQFAWSCLAQGSLVTMADGSQKAVEAVEIGEQVRSGKDGQPLTVIDITKGTESTPIVRIKAANGSEILATQGHPMVTAGDDAMRRADALKVGDQVRTASGLSKITAIEREPYGGMVYNLKLGTDSELKTLGGAQPSHFANGFLVGDARAQWALTVAEQEREPSFIESLPPAEWLADYVSYAMRKALR